MRLRRPAYTKLSRTIGLTAILLLMPAVLAAQEKIVFESERDGNPEIYVMNADGGNQTRMTFNSAFDTRPAFSPGGSKIVFTSSRDGNGEIYIMHADGSAQTNLTRNPALDDAPAFSPDGQRIAFISNRAGQRDIWMMNVDGSDPKQLTNGIAGVDNPAFSSDGRKIVFQATGTGPYGTPDSPMDEQLSARVQWGDGQSTQVVTTGAPGSILETHQYSAMGNYTITIEVFDNDAGHGIKTIDVVVSPPAPPAAPSGLRVDSIAINRIDIQWTDNSNNEDGFAVERCAQRGCNNFIEIGRVFPDNRHFVDSGQLFANTQYYYRVRAFNAGGMSAYTDVVSAKTLRK